MSIERRAQLRARLTDHLGHEVTTLLLDELPPPGERLATLRDLDDRFDAFQVRMDARMDARFEAVGARFAAVDARFDAFQASTDARFDSFETRLELTEQRLTAVFRGELMAAVTTQTRTLILTMGGTVVSFGALLLVATRTA